MLFILFRYLPNDLLTTEKINQDVEEDPNDIDPDPWTSTKDIFDVFAPFPLGLM